MPPDRRAAAGHAPRAGLLGQGAGNAVLPASSFRSLMPLSPRAAVPAAIRAGHGMGPAIREMTVDGP